MRIKTDTNGVELELGEHINGNDPHMPALLPIDQAVKALVDVANKRVVWLSTQRNMTTDSRLVGGNSKIMRAIACYEHFYKVKLQTADDSPGTDRFGLKLASLTVDGGVVISHVHTTQKHTYVWDWTKMEQVKSAGGWKF